MRPRLVCQALTGKSNNLATRTDQANTQSNLADVPPVCVSSMRLVTTEFAVATYFYGGTSLCPLTHRRRGDDQHQSLEGDYFDLVSGRM